MLDQLTTSLQLVIDSIKLNYPFVIGLMVFLWVFNIVNWSTGSRLNILGIIPRNIYSLPGIIFSPILHYDFNHLFFNSIPLFVLASLILIKGKLIFWFVTATVTLISGLAVWLFGRRSIHIGASGLVMGYFGFILANAYHNASMIAVIAAILGLYYFSGLLLALIPSGEKGISWEGHIFGFLAGIAATFLM